MMVHLVNVRADAARNSARIFEAARELVAAQGPEVPMEAIAGRAGVAVGTLYRHHPTKAALLRAVLTDSAEQLADATEQALERARAGSSAGTELEGLIGRLAERLAVDQAVKAAATTLGERLPADPLAYPDGSPERRAVDALAGVLEAAQLAGDVRGDVRLADLVLLVSMLPGPGVDAAQRGRLVEILLAGLRAPAR
jgi:AcrR family transcriptional regulator